MAGRNTDTHHCGAHCARQCRAWLWHRGPRRTHQSIAAHVVRKGYISKVQGSGQQLHDGRRQYDVSAPSSLQRRHWTAKKQGRLERSLPLLSMRATRGPTETQAVAEVVGGFSTRLNPRKRSARPRPNVCHTESRGTDVTGWHMGCPCRGVRVRVCCRSTHMSRGG